jgi:hypothetical protein
VRFVLLNTEKCGCKGARKGGENFGMQNLRYERAKQGSGAKEEEQTEDLQQRNVQGERNEFGPALGRGNEFGTALAMDSM